MARKRNRLLVPEAREALDRLICDVIQEKSQEKSFDQDVKCDSPVLGGDNGDMKSREAGKVGGQIGGTMVQRLVEMAKQQLKDQNQK